jgi:hypothetical protein
MSILSDGSCKTRLSGVVAGMFLLVACFTVSISAATIGTSVSCGLSEQGQSATSVSDSSSCEIGNLSLGGPGDGYANASASVAYAVAGNRFDSTVSASADTVPPGLFLGSASATADASLSVELYTTGPVRQGVLEVLTGGNFAGVTGGDGTGSTEYSLSPTGIAAGCTGALCFNDPLLQPILLGTTFQFNEDMQFAEAGNYISGAASGFGTSELTFLFFEAGGVTPVLVSEAPEPCSCPLLAIGVLSVVGGSWRSSRVWPDQN